VRSCVASFTGYIRHCKGWKSAGSALNHLCLCMNATDKKKHRQIMTASPVGNCCSDTVIIAPIPGQFFYNYAIFFDFIVDAKRPYGMNKL